jgi:hypothetical protein
VAFIGWLGLLAVCPAAKAEFNFQTYRNRNSADFTFLDSARDPSKAETNPSSTSIVYHYFYNPVGYDQGEDGRGSLVSGVHNINVASEYVVSPKFSLGVDMPMHQVVYHNEGSVFALGDLRACVCATADVRGRETIFGFVGTFRVRPYGRQRGSRF